MCVLCLQAYADYYDVMDMTEELVSGLVKEVTGSYRYSTTLVGLQHPSRCYGSLNSRE